jgi:putative membrane protein
MVDSMIAVRELPHVLAVINAATIIVLLRAYSLIRARDREGHRRTMFVAISLGVAFLAVYLVYHAFSGLAKFGGHGAIRPIYFTLLAVHVLMAFVVAVLVPVTFYNAMKQRFATHKRFARVTLPLWLFVAVSGLVVYVMAVHLYPMNAS